MIQRIRSAAVYFATVNFAAVVLAALLLIAPTAEAGELRILDSHGLVRVTAEVKRDSAVVLTLAAPVSGGSIQLSNVNGIAPDISGAMDGTIVRFRSVPEGVWRVVVPAPNVTVVKIVIQ